MPDDDRKAVLLKMDQELHDQIKDMADHYGSTVRGTMIRYLRLGLTLDEDMIRREREAAREKGASSA